MQAPNDDLAHAASADPLETLGRFGRFGRFVSIHHVLFASVWVVVIAAASYLAVVDKKDLSNDFRVPNTDSQAAYDLLEDEFASRNGATAKVVFWSTDGKPLDSGDSASSIKETIGQIEKLDKVTSVSNPLSLDVQSLVKQVAGSLPPEVAQAAEQFAQNIPSAISADGNIAFSTVTYSVPITTLITENPINSEKTASQYSNPWSDLNDALAPAREQGLNVAIGGPIGDTYNAPTSWWANHADEVGLAIGALLLFLAFGSLFGAAIPISTALFGAVTASGLVSLLASVFTISSSAMPVTLMLSLGVGLDYSLLIVTRFREFVANGIDPHNAVGAAMQTAGTSSVFAGLTVCVALLGLTLVPLPLVQTIGLAAAIGVAVMIVAASTLLPALLGFAGRKIDAVGIPKRHERARAKPGVWERTARRIVRRPWFALIAGTAILLAFASPFLSIDFGMPSDESLPDGLSQREAYEELATGFGPGINAPLIVAVGVENPISLEKFLVETAEISKAVGAEESSNTVKGVDFAVGPIPNSISDVTAAIYQITPTTGPDSGETSELVTRLRRTLSEASDGSNISVHVGGQTATLIDLTRVVTSYLPIVVGGVVIGAFLLLVVVFRSILVPLKAAFLNLVSIGAAYGVVVAVFEWGWVRDLVGISETIRIVSFVPLIMFVIAFGLSMDYEVFLMSRIKEEWVKTDDPVESVVTAVGATARVISTAALVMVGVFLSFVTNPDPTVKLLGFGMAVAVLLDATIVRMVLLPAVMALLGRSAWWLPSWLQWLPRVNLEGPEESKIS